MKTAAGFWGCAACALALLPMSCGFAPVDERGELYETVSLGIPDRDLRREFADFLDDKGVAVADNAALLLEVNGREIESIVSLTNTGTVNKLRLLYSVDVRIRRDGELVREDAFVLREVLTHNESRYLAKRKERRNIFRTMRARALDRIWFRIRQEIKS